MHLLTWAKANIARSTRRVLNVGGHLAFILPAPSSVSWISCGSLIGDLLHGNQSLPDVSTGERVPLVFHSFLQYKASARIIHSTCTWGIIPYSSHTYSSTHLPSVALFLCFYTSFHLKQMSAVAHLKSSEKERLGTRFCFKSQISG